MWEAEKLRSLMLRSGVLSNSPMPDMQSAVFASAFHVRCAVFAFLMLLNR
jgi:hypothetical protein